MAANERIRGLQVYRPIIYGSHARLLTEQEKELAPAGHTHRWTVFLTSATSPPPEIPPSSNVAPPETDMDYLPGGADDLSYLIKKVTFRLHETYTNPARVFDKPPFKVTETGWGEFTVTIRVQFVPESGEKPMNLAHPIKLHHWGPPIEASPVVAPPAPETQPSEAGPSEAAAPTPSPLPAGSVPSIPTINEPESAVPAPAAGDGDGMVVDPSPSVPPPSVAPITEDPSTPLQATVVAATTPISIAARYPVHSWQYDELVFSDPSAAFLSLLNEHPPSALPPRNRRARDQREEFDIRKGKKGRKSVNGGPLAVDGGSRTLGPTPSHSREPTAASTSGEAVTGLAALAKEGIPGEAGSADVPLEFSQEMEKGEWNRLNEARIRIVEEMDNWRVKLIAQEKELAKVKEEMRAVT